MNDDLRELYQDLILDHGKRPRNFRAQEHAQCEAVGHNPLCGDKLTLYLTVGDDGMIADASFQGEGCAISTASASIMTEVLKGKTAAQAKALFAYFHLLCTEGAPKQVDPSLITPEDTARLEALSGVRQYPMRVKCATLAWRTLESALSPNGSQQAKTE